MSKRAARNDSEDNTPVPRSEWSREAILKLIKVEFDLRLPKTLMKFVFAYCRNILNPRSCLIPKISNTTQKG